MKDNIFQGQALMIVSPNAAFTVFLHSFNEPEPLKSYSLTFSAAHSLERKEEDQERLLQEIPFISLFLGGDSQLLYFLLALGLH